MGSFRSAAALTATMLLLSPPLDAHDAERAHCGYAARGADAFAGDEARRHLPPDRKVDFEHLAGEIDVDPAGGTVLGRVTLRFAALTGGADEVTVHAGKRLVLHEIHDARGTLLDFRRDEEDVTVRLAAPLQAGQTDALKIRYSGEPEDGLHFVRADVDGDRVPEAWTQGETTFNRDWIPLWDYPNDRYTSELAVRVPKAYVVVGNGLLTTVTDESDRRVWRYRMEQDHVGYLLSLAIGQFEVVKREADGVELWYVVYPDAVRHIDGSGVAQTPAILETMARLTGVPYPYKRYAQTVASRYVVGGMENITATTLARERMAYPPTAALAYDGMPLVAHEAAHQWFGNLLTCRDWAHIWLNEGFATYYEGLYALEHHGASRLFEEMDGIRRWYLAEAKRYTRPIVTYVMDRPGSLFDAHTYGKGAWVLHMLRHEVGVAGFDAGVRLYVKRHTDGLVETYDLVRAMEDATGRNLHAFFDQWVYRAGHPRLRVTVSDDQANRLIRVAVRQQTKEPFDVPLVVRVTAQGAGPVDHRLRIADIQQVFYLPRPDELVTVEVDPDGALLKEAEVASPVDWQRAQLERGSTTQSQVDAARALGGRGDDATNIERLGKVMLDAARYRTVRVAAAKALAAISGDGACGRLRDGLKADEARVRRASADGLSRCKSEATAEALEAVAEDDPSVHVRAAALTALGSMGKHAPRKVLERAIEERSWYETTARGAVAGVARVSADWAMKRLLKTATDRMAAFRTRAAAVGALPGALDRAPESRSRVLSALRSLVRDEDNEVVRAALRALTIVGGAEDVAHLEEGIRRLPAKWYHKEVARWRRALQDRADGAAGDAAERRRVRELEEKIEKLEERLRDLEARR